MQPQTHDRGEIKTLVANQALCRAALRGATVAHVGDA